MKKRIVLSTGLLTLIIGAGLALSTARSAEDPGGTQTQTLKGEIVDLMCYLDHGAKGDKHKGCAAKCIKSGGPVGLLSGDQVYLVIGDHEPINEALASKAAQTVTLRGKVVGRSGMKMIENAQVVE